MKEGLSISQTCLLFSWKCMSQMIEVCLRMDKQYYVCMRTFLMQSVPNNNSLAWVGHGNHQRKLWMFIASCSLSVATKESWRGCLTTSSPCCTGWYLNKIHLACPKKWCMHYLTLNISMPHLVAPSLGSLAWRSLCMSYWGFPQISWSCKRLLPHLNRVINRTTQEEEGTMVHSSLADWVVRDPYLERCKCWGRGLEEVWVRHQDFYCLILTTYARTTM